MPEGIVSIVLGVLFTLFGLLLVATWEGVTILLIGLGLLVWGVYCYRESGKEAREDGAMQVLDPMNSQPQMAQADQPVSAQYMTPVLVPRPPPPSPYQTQPSVVVNLPAPTPPMVLMKCSHCGTVGNLLAGKCQGCGAAYL